MTEQSLFWDTTGVGDGPAGGYTEAQLLLVVLALFAKNVNRGGVSPEYLNELAVTGTSSPVSVATGAAVVDGVPYLNSSPVSVVIPVPGAATRIDRVVLRASWSAQTVRVTRIAGSEGGAAPNLTQSDGVTWDIPLARVSITTGGVITVTDERGWLDVTGDGAVSTAKLIDAAVTTAKLADANVTTAKLADDAVTQAKIGVGAVGTTELADDAVTNAKIGVGAVGTTELANDGVTQAKIGVGAVGTTELADDAVTQAKIGVGAVGTTELADDAVTQAKIGSDTLRMMVLPLGGDPSDSVYYSGAYTTLGQQRFGANFDLSKLPATATVKLQIVAKQLSALTPVVRLYNATNGTAIAGSEVSATGLSSPTIITSSDFKANLPSGPKLYLIQASTGGGSIYVYRASLLVEW